MQGYSLLSIDASGLTALHHASRYGHKDVVRFLIAYAPNSLINMIDNDKGQTALHKAAAMKRRSISYMLVAGGSNLLIQDHEGKTPKILALEADDHELAAYLESKWRGNKLIGTLTHGLLGVGELKSASLSVAS